jgi:hypothetical protein
MNHSNPIILACLSVFAASLFVAGCETRERVVVHEPVHERVVVHDPPPPVIQEKVIVRP